MRGWTILAAALALLVTAADAFAHGGEFSNPPLYRPKRKKPAGDVPPPPGPSTGGGNNPVATTKGADSKLGEDPWRLWWTANRRSLVRTRAALAETVAGDAALQGDASNPALIALGNAIFDADDDVATSAIIASAKPYVRRSDPRIVQVLLDRRRTQTAREAAACALGLLGVAGESADGAASARSALERTVLEADAPARLRGVAVLAMGLRGDPAGVEFLLDLTRTSVAEPQVVAAAATSLGLLGTAEARAELRRLVASGRPQDDDADLVRIYAAQGLALAGDVASIADLRRVAGDPEPSVRRAAVLALAALAPAGDDAVQQTLRRRLDSDPDVACRDLAVLALGRQGHRASLAVLQDAIGGGRNVHPTFAATALGLWSRRNPGTTAGVEILRRSLTAQPDAALRGAVCVALALAQDRAAAPIVLGVAQGTGEPWMRACAVAAVAEIGNREEHSDALRRLLAESEPPEVRREAAIALGSLGDTGAAALLERLVEEADTLYLRGAAAVALGRVGGPAATRRLTATLQSKDPPAIVRAMAAVGLGILFDRPRERTLHHAGVHLDPYSTTEAVAELLSIL